MKQEEIDERWFSQLTVPGVAFNLNDSVNVIEGEHKGKAGAVIALITVKPEPLYIVELGSGEGDVEVREASLSAME